MFTRRTIDEACSPSEKTDSIKGWRRKRYAAMAATRHVPATQSLKKHLRRKRDLCMAALPHPLRGEAPDGSRGEAASAAPQGDPPREEAAEEVAGPPPPHFHRAHPVDQPSGSAARTPPHPSPAS